MSKVRSTFSEVLCTSKTLILRDLHEENKTTTITNDIENVVKYLYDSKKLIEGMVFAYYDSYNNLTYVKHNSKDGFVTFIN